MLFRKSRQCHRKIFESFGVHSKREEWTNQLRFVSRQSWTDSMVQKTQNEESGSSISLLIEVSFVSVLMNCNRPKRDTVAPSKITVFIFNPFFCCLLLCWRKSKSFRLSEPQCCQVTLPHFHGTAAWQSNRKHNLGWVHTHVRSHAAIMANWTWATNPFWPPPPLPEIANTKRRLRLLGLRLSQITSFRPLSPPFWRRDALFWS